MKNKQKQLKDLGRKQVDILEALKPNNQDLTAENMIPEDVLSDEAKNELSKIKEIEKPVARENSLYRANNYAFSFKNFQTIKAFDCVFLSCHVRVLEWIFTL